MYDYKCERCSIQFEIRQSFQDRTLTVCPDIAVEAGCEAPGEGPVRKVFSSVGIAFKGEGFYKNDHGSNARGRKAEQDAMNKSEKTESEDNKSTSKESSYGKNTSSENTSGKSASSEGSSSESSTTKRTSTANKTKTTTNG